VKSESFMFSTVDNLWSKSDWCLWVFLTQHSQQVLADTSAQWQYWINIRYNITWKSAFYQWTPFRNCLFNGKKCL